MAQTAVLSTLAAVCFFLPSHTSWCFLSLPARPPELCYLWSTRWVKPYGTLRPKYEPTFAFSAVYNGCVCFHFAFNTWWNILLWHSWTAPSHVYLSPIYLN